jgi:hypothetical protein
MNKNIFWSSILIITIFFFACSNDENSDENTSESSDTLIERIDLPSQLGIDSGEVKMFTMPTPLQIASALKIMEVEYDDDLLIPNNNVSFGSDIDMSLNLGMSIVDLGYATVYENPQRSLNCARDIQVIIEELPISYYVNDGFIKRFKTNSENQDSLYAIILDVYNDANQHLTENEDEALGLLILTGAYIEGLHIASSSNVPHRWIKEHDNVFIQQKLFLDNFLVLLDGYTTNSKIASIVETLSKLKIAFDEIKISFNDKTEAYELKSAITSTNRNNIKEVITNLRNEILSVNH